MTTKILVLCPFEVDCGLLCKAIELVGNERVCLLAPEGQAGRAAEFGVQEIHTLPDEFSCPDDGILALWLAEKIEHWNCNIVLAPATVRLRGVLPMLARYLKAGLTADCTRLSMEDGVLIQTRPAFGNSLMADIRTLSKIQMATVRPGTFPVKEGRGAKAQIVPEQPPTPGERVCLADFRLFDQGTPLSQAQIVIAGGMGVGSRSGFERLEQLAQKLGAAVAASRSAVDAGFAPYRCQVGMTGVTVSPKIYIAVGISGAVQHLAGMSGALTVVAINSDPKAPIFDYADYGIVGDWETVMEQLLEEAL